MKRKITICIFFILGCGLDLLSQKTPEDISAREILIEAITPEELYQRSLDRVKAAQESGSISGDWQVEQFAFGDRSYKSINKDYERFLKVIKNKGLGYKELGKSEFEENLESNHKAETYFVTYDFTVYEEGERKKYLIVVLDVKLLSADKNVIYVGGWKNLGSKIIKTPHNPKN